MSRNFINSIEQLQIRAKNMDEQMKLFKDEIEKQKSENDTEELGPVRNLEDQLRKTLSENPKTMKDFESNLSVFKEDHPLFVDGSEEKGEEVSSCLKKNAEGSYLSDNAITSPPCLCPFEKNVQIMNYSQTDSVESVDYQTSLDGIMNYADQCDENDSSVDAVDSFSTLPFCLQETSTNFNSNDSLDDEEFIYSFEKMIDDAVNKFSGDFEKTMDSQANVKNNKGTTIEDLKNEIAQTRDKIREEKKESKNLENKIKIIQNEPSVLIRSINDALLTFDNVTLNKYEEELEKERKKILSLMKEDNPLSLDIIADPDDKDFVPDPCIMNRFFILKHFNLFCNLIENNIESNTENNVVRSQRIEQDRELRTLQFNQMTLTRDVENLHVELDTYILKNANLRDKFKELESQKDRIDQALQDINQRELKCFKISDHLEKHRRNLERQTRTKYSQQNIEKLELKLSKVKHRNRIGHYQSKCEKTKHEIAMYSEKLDMLALAYSEIVQN